MNLKLIIAVSVLAAMPALAQAQQRPAPPPSAAKPSKAEVQKVVQIISGDKTKTQNYCDLGKLNEQMAQAEQKKDNKRLEALGKRADDLAQKIGPEYVKLMDALEQVDENSNEAKEFAALFEPVDKLCKR